MLIVDIFFVVMFELILCCKSISMLMFVVELSVISRVVMMNIQVIGVSSDEI